MPTLDAMMRTEEAPVPAGGYGPAGTAGHNPPRRRVPGCGITATPALSARRVVLVMFV
ncbi:MAG: hypothetical protein WCC65_13660 [Pseudonocardiaceae bacterium]